MTALYSRRSLLGGLIATAGGLLLPYEPRRVYSFARDLRVPVEAGLRVLVNNIEYKIGHADYAPTYWGPRTVAISGPGKTGAFVAAVEDAIEDFEYVVIEPRRS